MAVAEVVWLPLPLSSLNKILSTGLGVLPLTLNLFLDNVFIFFGLDSAKSHTHLCRYLCSAPVLLAVSSFLPPPFAA